MEADKLKEAAERLREEGFSRLVHYFATDLGEEFEVRLVLENPEGERVTVKSRGKRFPSLSKMWKGAELREREMHELFGISQRLCWLLCHFSFSGLQKLYKNHEKKVLAGTSSFIPFLFRILRMVCTCSSLGRGSNLLSIRDQ